MGIIKRSQEYKERWLTSHEEKYPVNYDFFSKTSQELFYFLGYLAGDGCVYNGSFAVGSTDRIIIEIFQKAIAPKNKIYQNKSGYCPGNVSWWFKLKNEKMSRLLSFYNVKSPSIFQRIPSEFIYSFIRGFMDSDGGVYSIKRESCLGIYMQFFQNDKLFLEELKGILIRQGLKPQGPYSSKGGKSWTLQLGVRDSLLILPLLYNSKGIFFLRRKYEVYQCVLESRKNMLSRSEVSRMGGVAVHKQLLNKSLVFV